MFPGGTLASNPSVRIYVAVGPTVTPDGTYYNVPMMDGAVWTDLEYQNGRKTFDGNGIPYFVWNSSTAQSIAP